MCRVEHARYQLEFRTKTTTKKFKSPPRQTAFEWHDGDVLGAGVDAGSPWQASRRIVRGDDPSRETRAAICRAYLTAMHALLPLVSFSKSCLFFLRRLGRSLRHHLVINHLVSLLYISSTFLSKDWGMLWKQPATWTVLTDAASTCGEREARRGSQSQRRHDMCTVKTYICVIK